MSVTLREQVELIVEWLRRRPQGESFGDQCAREMAEMLQKKMGGEKIYVPAHKKRSHLETIESAGDDATPRQLSKLLGVSVVHARRLKRLRR